MPGEKGSASAWEFDRIQFQTMEGGLRRHQSARRRIMTRSRCARLSTEQRSFWSVREGVSGVKLRRPTTLVIARSGCKLLTDASITAARARTALSCRPSMSGEWG